MALPTQDQVMAQLRVLIPAVGIASPDKVGTDVAMAMTAVGPIAYVIVVIWSLIANSRASIMASAAKPAAPGLPAPQIVLPAAEADLAQNLPSNVTSK